MLKAAETAVEGKVTKQRRKSERERLVRKHIIALSSPLHRLILMIDTSTRALPEDRAPSCTLYIVHSVHIHSVQCTHANLDESSRNIRLKQF